MNLAKFISCDVCGNIANQNLHGVCPECIVKDQDDFAKVKEILRIQESADMDEVSEKSGIEVKRIRNWVSRGRLKFVS